MRKDKDKKKWVDGLLRHLNRNPDVWVYLMQDTGSLSFVDMATGEEVISPLLQEFDIDSGLDDTLTAYKTHYGFALPSQKTGKESNEIEMPGQQGESNEI